MNPSQDVISLFDSVKANDTAQFVELFNRRTSKTDLNFRGEVWRFELHADTSFLYFVYLIVSCNRLVKPFLRLPARKEIRKLCCYWWKMDAILILSIMYEHTTFIPDALISPTVYSRADNMFHFSLRLVKDPSMPLVPWIMLKLWIYWFRMELS